MRQFTYCTIQNRLLTFLFTTLIFSILGIPMSIAQKSTVLIDTAIAFKKDSLLLNLKIKRFKSQDLTLELKHMNSKFIQRFGLAKSLMIDIDGNCFIRLRLKFPPGDIQILLFDSQNLPLCNPRRQNTDENAKDYDPSKGNN